MTIPRFPLPDRVCSYGSRAEFDSCRKESGQWVFWKERVNSILDGRYGEVKPLHVELSPTYKCNFDCSWCSCNRARVNKAAKVVEHGVMAEQNMEHILSELARHSIGIMWVGGEPTMHPLLYEFLHKGEQLGIQQCLFTNGSLLNEKRIVSLFQARLIFVRVSINAVTDRVHREYHGYQKAHEFCAIVRQNVKLLASLRRQIGSKTLIGLSLVVDDRNVDDVIPTVQFIEGLCHEIGRKAIDYVIIRPAYRFSCTQIQLRSDTVDRLARLVDLGSEARARLQRFGVDVVAPIEAYHQPPVDSTIGFGDECLACGWFAEIDPAGEMMVCSDRYGDLDYSIGNLAYESLDKLWNSRRRAQVNAMACRIKCFRTRCPRNGRGFYLNRVFHTIESHRREGRMGEVHKWIDNLRSVLPKPSHPFFI